MSRICTWHQLNSLTLDPVEFDGILLLQGLAQGERVRHWIHTSIAQITLPLTDRGVQWLGEAKK
jgi:hypothetical protein